MKKLLLGAFIMFGALFSAQAQLPYAQNFEVSMATKPAGWGVGSATYHPGNAGWAFNDVWPAVGPQDWRNYVYTHTYCAFVDDIDYNSSVKDNYDTLYTSVFNASAGSRVFISFDLNFNNYTGSEVGTLAVSTNGGLTWTTAINLPSAGGDISWHNGNVYDISSYVAGKANVELAFTWNNVGAVTMGYAGWGMAVDNINVYIPLNYDLAATSTSNNYMVTPGTPTTLQGTLFNWGYDSIVSMDLEYSVNGGPKVTDAVSGIGGFNRLTAYNYSHSTPFTPATPGNYKVRIWADNFNGANVDQNNANDTIYEYFTVIDSVQPKQALFEEYMQASCNPCMYAGPNIEPVLYTAYTGGYCNSFRYHVNWPGVDYMNDETQAPFVNTRVGYYGVDGVPDGKIDGTTDVAPGSVTTGQIQAAANMGSPLSITITSCTYNTVSRNYNVQAAIKAYAAIPEATIARVVLSVDSIKYDSNQSDEDPTSSFPGTNPWSYYKYVKTFAQVAEDMLPSSAGTALGGFADGQTQTINLNWKPNHPWGQNPKKGPPASQMYDSTFPGVHMTVFIQEDQSAANTAQTIPGLTYPSHAQSGALTTYIYQSASAAVQNVTGIEEIANGVYFEMYPNPTNSNTNISFKLDDAQDVSIQVYNMLGEKVYSVDNGKMSSGQHMITINGQGLQSGVYFVRFTTDNATTTKRLVIQK
jgi:hypothetical protein